MGCDRIAEQLSKQRGAAGIALVQGQRDTEPNRLSGQHAGTGRGFEHLVVLADTRGLRGEPGKRDRRTELLHLDLMLAAIGLGGERPFEAAKRGECIGAVRNDAGPASR